MGATVSRSQTCGRSERPTGLPLTRPGGSMAANRSATRAMLILLTLVGVMGCSSKPKEDEAPAAEAAPLAQGERAIKRDEWASEPFKLEDSTAVQVSATLSSGPAIDVLVLSEADFNKWNT